MKLKDSIQKIFYIGLVLIAIFCPAGMKGQTESWRSKDWQVGSGSTYIYDDYLSPISYNGLSLRFSTESFKPYGKLLNPYVCKWYNQYCMQFLPAFALTRSGSALYHIQADFKNTTFYNFYKLDNLSLYAGGYFALRGGGRLIQQSRNNPGSADIMTDIGVSFMAGYRFSLWGKTMNARYLGNMALVGMAFSPDYVQSYYEVFSLGNYENTIKFNALHNRQQWMQQFSLDISLSGKQSSLRFSYWNEGRISHMNNIKTKVLSDQLTVGYILYFKVL